MTDIIVVIRSVVVVLTIALLKLLVMGSKVAVKYSLNPDRVLLLMAAGASINSDELVVVVVVVVDVDTELDMVLVIGSSFKVIEPASFNEV